MKLKEENEKSVLKLIIKKSKIMASDSITSWQIEKEKVEAVTNFIFLGSKITMDSKITSAMTLKDAYSLEESYDKPRQYIKKQRHHFADKGPYSKSSGFSSSCVHM